MVTALVVDDDKAASGITKLELERAFPGATVEVIPGQTCQEFADALRVQLMDAKWDFLIMDIHYQNEVGPRKDWGGVFVHNQLIEDNLRSQWKNTIVVTKHYREGVIVNFADMVEGPGLNYHDQKTVEEFILYVFASSAGIPKDLVMPSFIQDREYLIRQMRKYI